MGTLAKTKQNCVLWTVGFHFRLMGQHGPMFLQLLLAFNKASTSGGELMRGWGSLQGLNPRAGTRMGKKCSP